MRMWTKRAGTLLVAAALFGGCEPTPEFVEQWANTPGSEERFANYLRDMGVSHEVRVKSLELLLRQWTYSSQMMAGGALLREIPDAAERDAVIRDVLPFLQQEIADAAGAGSARDGLLTLRQGTDNAALQGEIDQIFVGYLNTNWTPCLQTSGQASAEALFNLLNPTLTAPRVISVLREASNEELDCFVSTINDVSWFSTNAEVAAAYIERYNSGNVTDHPQAKYTFLEYSVEFSGVPAVRDWYFEKIRDPATDPLHLNFMLDAVGQTPGEEDRARYVSLLSVPTLVRWTAFDMLVKIGGSEGLEQALSNLPATGPMNYYDGATPANGFKLAAENIACNRPRLSELGDYARQTFERHVEDANLNARALSIMCLRAHGNAQTVTRLTTLLTTLGAEPVATPEGFSGMSFQDLITETITAIQTRLAAPPAPPTPPTTP